MEESKGPEKDTTTVIQRLTALVIGTSNTTGGRAGEATESHEETGKPEKHDRRVNAEKDAMRIERDESRAQLATLVERHNRAAGVIRRLRSQQTQMEAALTEARLECDQLQ
ncbi:hypothetical protein LTR53_014559 [Teratosphaeriaceae sp. CCFEE 6253]|nr:hypothetical protein LTR53_014559 [Teratosphaeriaceae sp. CCFEE 6253]